MEREIVRPGGSVSFWKLESTRLAAAQAALEPAGVTVKPQQPSAALRVALEGLHPKHLVRPLAGQTGYCVVDERKGARGNLYETLGSAWFASDRSPMFTGETYIDVDGILLPSSVNGAYRAMREIVTPTELAEALKTYVLQNAGVPLREMGGVYWIPPASLGGWRQVAAALTEARGGTVYNVTIHADVDAAAALNVLVRDHLVGEAQRIMAEASNQDLGKRALSARIEALDRMVRNTRGFEDVLEASLSDLRTALGAAKIELTDALVALNSVQRRERKRAA